jgi:hypothetical protein
MDFLHNLVHLLLQSVAVVVAIAQEQQGLTEEMAAQAAAVLKL